MRFVLGLMLAAAPALAVEDECGERRYRADQGVELRRAGLWSAGSYREPFVLGRPYGLEEIPVGDWAWRSFTVREMRHGSAKLSLRVEDALPDGLHQRVAGTVSALPGVVVQRLPRMPLDVVAAVDGPATAHFEGDESRIEIPSYALESSDFGLLLLHEMAHVLDYESRWSWSETWTDAIADSPCPVSDYAMTNPQEDFAESVVAFFLYYAARVPHHIEEPEDWRYRRYMADQRRERLALRKEYRQRLGARFGVLRRLMH